MKVKVWWVYTFLIIAILICCLMLSVIIHASDQVKVEAEFAQNKRGNHIYRLHNYEKRRVDCFIYGDYEYFDSFIIKKRSASQWMYTPSGLIWECY